MNLEIANRLVELRKQAGYSQEELAAKIGVSRQAISKWERGEASPDTDNLIALSRLYGVSLDEMLGNVPEQKEEVEAEVVEPAHEIKTDDDDDEDEPRGSVVSRLQVIVTSIGFTLALAAYLAMGFAWKNPGNIGWAAGWIVFLVPPFISSVLTAIEDRKMTRVAVPLLIVGIYCGMGIIGNFYGINYWHPWWALFFLIPIYYSIFGVFERNR